jgi:hypothetical protein
MRVPVSFIQDHYPPIAPEYTRSSKRQRFKVSLNITRFGLISLSGQRSLLLIPNVSRSSATEGPLYSDGSTNRLFKITN